MTLATAQGNHGDEFDRTRVDWGLDQLQAHANQGHDPLIFEGDMFTDSYGVSSPVLAIRGVTRRGAERHEAHRTQSAFDAARIAITGPDSGPSPTGDSTPGPGPNIYLN